MQKEIDALADLLEKIKRIEGALSPKVENLIKSEKTLSDLKNQLTLEVMEIKAFRESLPELAKESLEESAESIISELLPLLVKGFQKESLGVVKSATKEAQRLKEDVDETISEAKELASSFKKTITLKGVGVILSFCLGSLLSAGGICYFFPQHVSVTYGMTNLTAEMVVFGEAFIENWDKLTASQKAFYFQKAREKLQAHAPVRK